LRCGRAVIFGEFLKISGFMQIFSVRGLTGGGENIDGGNGKRRIKRVGN
jgi:hypothetical protein